MPPLLPQPSSLSPATPPRYQLMAADGDGRAEVGGKVLEPPAGVEARLTDAERDLLHRQLRQAAREQPLSRAR